MRFWSYGPIGVDPENRDEFWKLVDEWSEFDELPRAALREAIGCYVFTMRWGQKAVPYYVGKTNAKTGFYREVLTDRNREFYRQAIAAKPKYKAEMFLFPLITNTERLSRSFATGKPVIEWMERTLIGMALAKNPELYNLRDTKYLRNCIVDGVFGSKGHKAQYDAAAAARRVLTDYVES